MPDLLERLSSALGDRYAIEREVGRGGMAVVFLAEHRCGRPHRRTGSRFYCDRSGILMVWLPVTRSAGVAPARASASADCAEARFTFAASS